MVRAWLTPRSTDLFTCGGWPPGPFAPSCARGSSDRDHFLVFNDGRRLLVSGLPGDADKPSVWMIPTDGAAARRLRENARRAFPSPDGSQIVFTQRDDSEIWVMGAAGEEPHRIVAGGNLETFPTVFWSPDGKRVEYERLDNSIVWDPRVDGPVTKQRSYESVDLETRQVVAWARDINMTSGCSLPDGRILFLWASRGGGPDTVYELGTDPQTGKASGLPRPIAHVAESTLSNITSSADGKQIAVVWTTS